MVKNYLPIQEVVFRIVLAVHSVLTSIKLQ